MLHLAFVYSFTKRTSINTTSTGRGFVFVYIFGPVNAHDDSVGLYSLLLNDGLYQARCVLIHLEHQDSRIAFPKRQ